MSTGCRGASAGALGAGAGEVLLSVRGLAVAYGGIRAVREVSFEVLRGEIVTLIGGNGAGKSSILRAVSGLVPREGQVVFDGRDLDRVPAHRIVALGIAHVPEGRGIFGNLTVEENLLLATWQRRFGRDRAARVVAPDLERVFAIFPRLRSACASRPARSRAASSRCWPSGAR